MWTLQLAYVKWSCIIIIFLIFSFNMWFLFVSKMHFIFFIIILFYAISEDF